MERGAENRVGGAARGMARAVAGALLLIGIAHAELPAGIALHGFGTAALTYHDAHGLEYRRNVSQAEGATAGELEPATDSMFGLQANAKLAEDLQLMVQGMAAQDATGSWKPRTVRALLSYRPSANVLVRAGRFGYESYLLAESPAVGYSYLPIRPAPEFFGLFASDDVDGLDAAVTRQLGPGVARWRVFAGHTTARQSYLRGLAMQTSSMLAGTQLDYSYHAWLFRAGASQIHVRHTADLSPLAEALRATGVPESVTLANRLEGNAHLIRGYQIAAAYDGRPLQGQILLTRVESDMIAAPKLQSGVAIVGYRWRSMTPFVSFARSSSFADILPTGLPPLPQLAPLDAAARAVQVSAQVTQSTRSIGVRYDLMPRLDLKLQADRIHLGDTTLVFHTDPTTPAPDHLTLFGLAVDFIF